MDFFQLIFYFLVIIPSAIIHEYSHGAVANALGDPTAKYAGRLTLNPAAHIDKWGTILLPLLLFFISGGSFIFAYAKPVPYNPYNLRYQRWGPTLVALAGPAANLTIALIFSLILRWFGPFFPPQLTGAASFLIIVIYANILLAVFNLVPIPPLDGSKLLFALLPPAVTLRWQIFFERYGLIILLFFIFYAWQFISPIIQWLFRLMTGLPA